MNQHVIHFALLICLFAQTTIKPKECAENKLKVMVIMGTRPEVVKLAPVVWELKKHEDEICTIVCDTGQHRQMVQPLYKLFRVKTDMSLHVMTPNQDLFVLSRHLLDRLGPAIRWLRPHIILVQGDTTTAFIAALASFYHQIPVGHVEAGLRSYKIYSPFPEEANRHMLSVLATYHYAPTNISFELLKREQVPVNTIIRTGNTVLDAVKWVLNQEPPDHPTLEVIKKFSQQKSKIVLITAHRRENYDVMSNMFKQIAQLAREHRNVQLAFPVHLSPTVQSLARSILKDIPNVHLLAPLSYDVFIHILKMVDLILTDSGGIQEEASYFGKPVLIMRQTTERPEGVLAGVAKLVKPNEIYSVTSLLLSSENEYAKMARRVEVYGDGHASERIVNHLLQNSAQLQSRNTSLDSENDVLPAIDKLGSLAYKLVGSHVRG